MTKKSECSFIDMPEKIYMTSNCVNRILKSFENIDVNKEKVALNFEKTIWLSAEATPFLGVLINNIKESGKKVVFFRLNDTSIRNILKKNGFLKHYNIDKKIRDNYKTTIPYKVLDSHDDEAIDLFLEKRVFSLIHKHIDQDEIEIIRDAVNEIAHNVKEHSNTSNLYFCGQFYPQKKYITLTLCDNGVTIPYNIMRKYDFISENSKAIAFATKKGKSTKHSASSGLGLYDIKKNIQHVGDFLIVSGSGFWKQDFDGDISKRNTKTNFPGTLVSLKFYLDDHKNRINLTNDDTIEVEDYSTLDF